MKTPRGNGAALLTLEGVSAGYGDLQVLHGVSLEVREGEVATLVGANGAGKTTTINTVSGLVASVGGSIRFAGEPLAPIVPHRRVERGLVQVPEGRRLFPFMTVRENLDLGCYPRAARREKQTTLGEVLALLPLLEQRLGQLAGTLSGGEQQMLAIGRALMARPRLLMLDEPTLGLAPRMVAQVFETIAAINGRGVTVLLVEQNVRHALKLAHRGYVLENGRVVLEGSGKDLLGDERLKKAYLGL
jgi:branched-chain amino acid transport system ATP-binding protein